MIADLDVGKCKRDFPKMVAAYHAIVIGDPGLIPRNLLADSPTMHNSSKPASLTIARNVNGGWS